MRKTKQNIESLQEFAENKRGKLISTEYINNNTKLLWKCEKGHQWEARWNNIKNLNQWCPYCAGKAKPNIIELQEFASTKGGKLISTKYDNCMKKLVWECKEGHQWKACWNNINNGNRWCPYCAGKAKPDITELQIFAIGMGGKLVSTKYINALTNISWECSEGHQWEARWNDIKNAGQWCPECSSFKTEHRCKKLLEQKFKFGFKKTRFHINNKRYEWDGYNEEHKVAFEYQGYQHSIYPNHWHKTLEIYEKAVQRDRDKVIYANENNIRLILISYKEENNLEEFIKGIQT